MPHLSMPGSSFYCFNSKPDYAAIATHDVCVVQRCCTPQQFEFLKLAAALGMKIIYDLDDDVWDLPKYNPAYEVLTRQKEGFNACIRMVDLVTVSTKTLAKVLRKNVKFMVNSRTGKEIPIVVCENRIWEPFFVTPRPAKQPLVGWAGSSSHVGDLPLVEEAILTCAEERPDVQFEFRGCELEEGSPLLKVRNLRHRYWTPVAEYGGRMPLWGWSIALAPVQEHPFNASKSCIKSVEAAYCGIPCLMSYVQPYEEFCRHDTELRWLLCAGPKNWTSKLRDLVNDNPRREELGRRAHAVMKQHYVFGDVHEQWAEALQQVRTL